MRVAVMSSGTGVSLPFCSRGLCSVLDFGPRPPHQLSEAGRLAPGSSQYRPSGGRWPLTRARRLPARVRIRLRPVPVL